MTCVSLCSKSVAAPNPHWCILDDAPLVLQALNSAIKAAYAANNLTLRGWRDQGAAVDTHLHQHLQPAASSLQQQCAAGADSFARELTAFWSQPPLQLQQAGQPKCQWANAACTVMGHRTPSSAAGSRRHTAEGHEGCCRPRCRPETCWDPGNIQRIACRLAQGKPGSLTAGGSAILHTLLCCCCCSSCTERRCHPLQVPKTLLTGAWRLPWGLRPVRQMSWARCWLTCPGEG